MLVTTSETVSPNVYHTLRPEVLVLINTSHFIVQVESPGLDKYGD